MNCKKNYDNFSLKKIDNPFLDSSPSIIAADTIFSNIKDISLYYITFHYTAINNGDDYIFKYQNRTINSEEFYEIEFNKNPRSNLAIQNDTLVLFYDSNTDYLVVRTWFKENGNKSYSLEHVDKKNLAGYFFTSKDEGIFKSENNTWVKVDSYEEEGRYMLTPFQYQKSQIVKIQLDKIIKAIESYK